MSLRVALLLLLLSLAYSYTDITMLNCPAQFNVTAYNDTSDSTAASIGAFVYAAFATQANKDRVEAIVVGGNTEELQNYENQMKVPYIILAVLYFCCYICLVLCCLFDRSCPPSECLRRKVEEDPYSKK
jgi:hypothetical protein